MTETTQHLVELARTLGDPSRNLVVLAEGNVSQRSSATTLLVKATGRSMARAEHVDIVELEEAPLLELLDDPGADDAAVFTALSSSRVDQAAAMPSVETLLHVVCQQLVGVQFAAHTHPVDVNAVLCSVRPSALVEGVLFPDQVVVLGRHQLLVPYADPGLTLARLARQAIDQYIIEHSSYPKAIYLQNHGLFALGESAQEVLNITVMAQKVAQITLGALAAGGPAFLSDSHANRIDSRPDEVARRAELARTPK